MLTLVGLAARWQTEAEESAAQAKDYKFRANSAYFDGKAAALYFAVRELRAALGVEEIDIRPARELDESAIPLRHDEPWVEERPQFRCVGCGKPCDGMVWVEHPDGRRSGYWHIPCVENHVSHFC